MRVRKIAAVMAAVSMLAAVSAQAAFAADSVTVTAEKVNAEAGAEFTLAVKLSGVPAAGVNAAEFELTYDASALTITGASAGDIVNSDASGKEGFDGVTVFDADFSEAGTVTVTYGVALDDSAYWVTKDGTFLTISGKVNDGTADGTYAVDVKAIDRETYEGSGTPNAEIFIGNMNSEGTITNYTVTAKAGAVVVGTTPSESETEATSETVKPSESGDILRGDADCNGVVNIVDVITMNKAIMGKENLSPQGLKNGDLNGDGTPTSEESLQIMKKIVGLIAEL